jgi:hypothetical protein
VVVLGKEKRLANRVTFGQKNAQKAVQEVKVSILSSIAVLIPSFQTRHHIFNLHGMLCSHPLL